jgi:amino acid adenylation domain-containing protein/non-ribosomal peptide synthase protein (TIGR01720 family)
VSIPTRPNPLRRLSPAKQALFDQWRRARQPDARAEDAIPRRDPGKAIPLSHAQERLWFLDQLEPQNPFYNVAAAIRLIGQLDAAGLQRAIAAVITRHEALRTTFDLMEDKPRQIVHSSIAWRLQRQDISEIPPVQQKATLRQLMEAEALRPFDLKRGPLIRGTLLTLGPAEHILLLTVHHIVCDGWSMALLRREVTEHYAANIEGRPPRLVELEIQYPDFAIWQREYLTKGRLARLLEYWSQKLRESPPSLDLPLDFPRTAEQTFRGAVCRRTLDQPILSTLRRVAHEENATLFMVLLAAYQLLLARYSGQHDLCVGTPIANRNRIQLEQLIGFFANTLVLRADLSGNPTFRDFLGQVRQTTLEAYTHQDLPFEQLVDHLQPRRDLSRTPLFQAMFVLQNIPLTSTPVANLTAAEVRFDYAPVSHFDLTLNVEEHSDRLDLSLVYNPDLFLADTIEQLLDSYFVLLDGLLADRDCPVLRLPLLSAASRKKLERWNETASPFPGDLCVPDLVDRQARQTPDAWAVTSPDRALTYADLAAQSTRLANRLKQLGVVADVPVAICLEPSPELVVALLAIWKAGGAYLPLDPAYPDARLSYMVRDAGIGLLLTSSLMASRFAWPGVMKVLLDGELAAAAERTPPPGLVRPDQLAYVLYTSGSTGRPKGVEVEHRGLVNHALEFAHRIGLAPGDRILQYLSVSFDAAAEEIFPALAVGAAIAMHPRPVELSGRELLDWSRRQGVNVLHVTPPVWLSLVDELGLVGPAAAAHLKTVIVGGDSVRRADLQRWRRLTADRIPLYLAYGVTEATITSTLFDSRETAAPSSSPFAPIGRPLANTRAYVLDEFGQPVPIGVPGELYLGGVGIARGYRNRPQLTAERFVPDSCSRDPVARMYRTGDRARLLHDGTLEFLGRLDQQVKVRGFRIEPAEIACALKEHPNVAEAVVIAIGNAHDEKQLVAYVAHEQKSPPNSTELREFLAARLPAHLVPASIVVLRELPRLPGGKLDRRSLPLPRVETTNGRATVPPRNDTERILTKIWAEVLGRGQVGIHDNFFSIGGDSIRSIQVISRAAAAGLRFTPKQLFQHQTIAELAPVARREADLRAEQGPVTGPAPLTPIQHEFFSLRLAEPCHFNQSIMLELRESVTPEVLDQAARRLLAHHDALRMRFAPGADGAWLAQGMPPTIQTALTPMNLSGVPDDDIDSAIERAASKAQSSLDLQAGPLARFVYFDLGANRPARLLIVIHHLVVDAVSWRILLDDLAALCLQLKQGPDAILPPKTTSFAHWSARLQSFADSAAVRRDLDFWLTDALPTPLPCDSPGGENLVADEEMVEVGLTADETARWLCDSHAAYRTRPPELLLAALVSAVCRYTGNPRLWIDLEGHGRKQLFDEADLSRTVGWFTSLYPVALETASRPDILIPSIKERLRAVPRGGISFGIARWLASDRTLRDRLERVPRGQLSFNYLGQLDGVLPAEAPFSLGRGSHGPERSPLARRPHVWELIAYVLDERLTLAWRFASTLHRPETIESLANQWLAALRALIEHCTSPGAGAATPSDFPLAAIDQQDLDQLSALLDRDDPMSNAP